MNQEYEENENVDEIENSGFMSYEELMEARKITFSDIKEHLTGPVISTVIHVVLLAFLGTIVVFKAPEKSKEITVEMKTIEPQEIEPPPPPPEPPDPVDVQNPTETPVERPNVDMNVDVQVENISVNDTSDVELPSVLNMKMSNSALTLSVPVGGGKGGGVAGKFLGTGGSGNRFVFILDYSCSMGENNLLVLKSHLMKALKAFKGRGEVALLFFAGPTWLPQEDGAAAYKKWGGRGKYDSFSKKDMSSFYPKPRWMVPNAHNLAILDKYICQSGKVGGTNWSHPFRVALDMKPKPQVIFFMTDGTVSPKIVDTCKQLIKSKGKDVTINTIAFGAEKGWKSLEELAKLSKGGVFKGYSGSDLKSMAKDVKLPTSFTRDTAFDYRAPKAGKLAAEKKVEGLTIK